MQHEAKTESEYENGSEAVSPNYFGILNKEKQ